MTNEQITNSAFWRFFTKKRTAVMIVLGVGIVSGIAAWPGQKAHHGLSEVPYAIDAQAIAVSSLPVVGLRAADRDTVWGSDSLPAGTQTLESENFGINNINAASPASMVAASKVGFDIAIIATQAITPDCKTRNNCVTHVLAIGTGAGFRKQAYFFDALTGGCPINGKNRISFGAGRKTELTCKG